jgi:Family of unknown function (DUF6535)
MGLTCAMLATLLQQWARRYVTTTQSPRYSPHKRARIRAFFADGIDKLHLPWAVEALPTLLHVSLFLFFSGLLVFLFNINHTVFTVVIWWVGLSTGVYGCITLMPIFRHDSPYYAPLSLSAWFIYIRVSYGFFRFLRFITAFDFAFAIWNNIDGLVETYRERLSGDILQTAQESALQLSGDIDSRVLRWTFDSLDEDHELERFFEGIPGFCNSEVVDNPKTILYTLGRSKLGVALSMFRWRTLSSSLLSETMRERRLIVYMKAANALDFPVPSYDFLFEVFTPGKDAVLKSVQIGYSIRSCSQRGDGTTSLHVQLILAGIIASVPERDYRWNALVMDQLGISEGVLREYLAHGDSVLLANLIHITSLVRRLYYVLHGDRPVQVILRTITKFDIRNTLPGLQHDFCASWNKLVREGRINDGLHYRYLRPMRHLYIALHQGTSAAPTAFSSSTGDYDRIFHDPSSYPLCNIPGHLSHTNQPVVGATGEITHPLPPTTSHTVPFPDTFPNSMAPYSEPGVSPLPVLSPEHSHGHHVDESSLNDVSHVAHIVQSSHPAPVDIEDHHFPTTSPGQATGSVTQGTTDTPIVSSVANSESVPPMAAPPLMLLPPLASLSRNIVSPQRNATPDIVTPSIIPSIPLSPSLTPVPSKALLDPQSPVVSPASLIDQMTAGPGFLPSSSETAMPLTISQVTPILQPKVEPYDTTFDSHDSSRSPDLCNNVETPQRSHQLAMPVPDITTNFSLSCLSLDT